MRRRSNRSMEGHGAQSIGTAIGTGAEMLSLRGSPVGRECQLIAALLGDRMRLVAGGKT